MLAMRRSPWLATVGRLLALNGLFAFIVFAGQEELSYLMAHMGAARSWSPSGTGSILIRS